MSNLLVVCDSVDSGISKVVRSSRNASSSVRSLDALTLAKASKMSDPYPSDYWTGSVPIHRTHENPGLNGDFENDRVRSLPE